MSDGGSDGRGARGAIERPSYRMFLLLHIIHGAILERPLHHIRFWRNAFLRFGIGELGPEVMKGFELDEMPHG